jgi:hypothetical protein
LPRICGDSLGNRLTAFLDHGSARGLLPDLAPQTPPRSSMLIGPLYQDEPQQSPTQGQGDRREYEHIVLRNVHSRFSWSLKSVEACQRD